MIEAIIFDMDGLLVDTEPFWQAAELDVFSSLGVPLTLEMCRETQGMRIDSAVRHWFDRYPWSERSLEEVQREVVDRVVEMVEVGVDPMDGVEQLFGILASKDIQLSICSSSPLRLIEAVLKELKPAVEFHVLHSAEEDERGKPHPDPYVSTARKMGVSRANCLVFEDSLSGCQSAKAAEMMVVAVPSTGNQRNPDFDFCDCTTESLREFINTDFACRILDLR